MKILPFFRCSGRRTSQERNLHNELVIEMSALSLHYKVGVAVSKDRLESSAADAKNS